MVNNEKVSIWWCILTTEYRILFFLNQEIIIFLILPFSLTKRNPTYLGKYKCN